MDFDNLKFQATKAQDSVVVSTETRIGDKFMGFITDFDKVQKPSSILKQEVCEEKILKNIREAMYSYKDDIIHVVIPLMGDYYAHCELNRVQQEMKSQIDENNLIEKIVWKLSEKLEPYEVIETFHYPSWGCFSDFENKSIHDNYRYFEAVRDWRKYMLCFYTDTTSKKQYYHLGEFMNNFVSIRGFLGDGGAVEKAHETNGLSVCSQNPYFFDYNGQSLSTFYDYEDPKNWYTITTLEKIRFTFSESCKKYVRSQGHYTFEFNTKLIYYIYEVVRGWLLLNFSYVCMRNPKVSIEIDDDKVTFKILRLKKCVYNRKSEHTEKYSNQDPNPKLLYLMPKIPIDITVEDVVLECK